MRASDFYIGFVERIRIRASNPINEFHGLNMVITLPSYELACNGARPSAGRLTSSPCFLQSFTSFQ